MSRLAAERSPAARSEFMTGSVREPRFGATMGSGHPADLIVASPLTVLGGFIFLAVPMVTTDSVRDVSATRAKLYRPGRMTGTSGG